MARRVRLQALVIVAIIVLSRRMTDPLEPDPTPPFDVAGAMLSALGLFFLVIGILQADSNEVLTVDRGRRRVPGGVPHLYPRARASRKLALLWLQLFKDRICNLGLVTQNLQRVLLMGVSFVVSVSLQTVRGYNAIQTRVVFTAAMVRDPRVLARSRASGEAPRAEDADHGWVRGHRGGDRVLLAWSARHRG